LANAALSLPARWFANPASAAILRRAIARGRDLGVRDLGRGLLQIPIVFALLLVYAFLFLRFFPDPDGYIGSDYNQHFPNLLIGYYWFLQNGLSAVPWFTPGLCGGMPFFADPTVPYYSLTQFLAFVTSPLHAVQYSFLLLALAGYVGMYRLLRGSFALTASAATVGAALFMFNDYFAARMLVGHLSFAAFPLIAIVAACLIPPPDRVVSIPAAIARIVVASLCLGAMVEAGMFHTIPPALLGCAMIILIAALRSGWRPFPWFALGAAGIGGLTLAAGKISASIAFIAHFPRDFYPLPGVADLGTLLALTARALFFGVPPEASSSVVNTMWQIGVHEWDYGMSPLPLALCAIALGVLIVRWALGGDPPTFSFGTAVASLALLVAIAIPLALNWYQPQWNAFLKSLPFFKSSSVMLRWFCAYVPVIAVLAGLAMETIVRALPHYLAPPAAALAVLALLAWVLTLDRSYYGAQQYAIAPIEEAAAKARASRSIVPITQVNAADPDAPVTRNDNPARGISEAACYQPAFGYRLEQMPVKQLTAGPALMARGTVLNIKNPACYVFPAENGCTPGDHFPLAARAEAEKFLNYQPFDFVQPLYQRVATTLSVASLAAAPLLLVIGLIWLAFAPPPRYRDEGW
jgi:hypothetical protein